MDAPQTNVAAASSTIALAGLGVSSAIEFLPKSVIVALCIIALTVVAFFVKRDYARLNDFMTTSNLRQASIEGAIRQLVTVSEHRESVTGVHRKIDALYERMEARVDDNHTRLTILETKQGLHNTNEHAKPKEQA